MFLDPLRVPESVAPLIPLAEKWGLGDDLERSTRVDTASPEELMDMVNAVYKNEGLWSWLAADAYSSKLPTDEYVVFSNLVHAFDYAKVLLDRSRDMGK
jgi:hypothetical protein